MKLVVLSISALVASTTAFLPSSGRRAVSATNSAPRTSPMFAEPEEEEGLDLDLGEMFDMFDAADKGVDFDKAIKEVKKES
mmetsp:Transcript_29750/g.66777  ORF Transcript_29750/g.66777 Transcript_29750/m.66777 type:complete len:81 (-) Transcript_29750:1920-2162(-)